MIFDIDDLETFEAFETLGGGRMSYIIGTIGYGNE